MIFVLFPKLCSRAVVLNWAPFCCQWDIWQCLETILVVTTGVAEAKDTA